MSVVKRHSYDIVKLYINQLGITVFSLILITALGSVSNSKWLELGLSVFTTAFFGVIIYTTAWDLGAKDKLSVDSGRAERVPFKGLLLSVFANLPNFALAGIAAICLAVSKSGDAFYSVGAVLLTIAQFTMAIYLGIVNFAVSFAADWGETSYFIIRAVSFFIVPVISIFVTQLGYYLGLREKKLFGGAMDAKRK